MVRYEPIPGFPGYEIGTNGKVRSFWRRRAFGQGRGTAFVLHDKPIILQPDNNHGYHRVCLYRNKKSHRKRVHLLVLSVFVGPVPAGHQGCHKDGVRSNNRLSNLRWGTPTSNQLDRWKHGTMSLHLAKLTAEQIIDVVNYAKAGKSRVELSQEYSIDIGTVNRILSGKTWSHVTGIKYTPTRGPYRKRNTT